MITILSPAKKLSKDCFEHEYDSTQPEHLKYSEKLISILKSFEPPTLMEVMGISENLSLLNWERFQNWETPFSSNNSRQAIFTFQGDTYAGLDADTLSENEILFAQKHSRILSGLYGLLKPLDLIMPYRLEMGTKLKNDSGENLYAFWGDELSKSLSLELKSHDEKFIVNCASVEYFKSVNNEALTTEIISPIFKEIKNGKVRIISIFAKKARGMMARFIIKNQINNPNDILHFNYGGYTYDKSLSSIKSPVFTRQQP